MTRVVVGGLALLVGACTHALAGVYFLIGTCAVSDVADRVPAVASPQGLLCDREQSWLNAVPYVALVASLLLAVALAVLLFSRGGPRRWLGLTACLWLPVVTSLALAAPPDTCTDQQARDLPAQECRTTPDG